jgi:hypothetical protein
MYRDIGVGDWTFELGQTSGKDLWAKLRLIHEDLPRARARVKEAMAKVAGLQRGMVLAIDRAIQARG